MTVSDSVLAHSKRSLNSRVGKEKEASGRLLDYRRFVELPNNDLYTFSWGESKLWARALNRYVRCAWTSVGEPSSWYVRGHQRA